MGVQKQVSADVVHVNWRRKTRWRRRAGWFSVALVASGALGYVNHRVSEIAAHIELVESVCGSR